MAARVTLACLLLAVAFTFTPRTAAHDAPPESSAGAPADDDVKRLQRERLALLRQIVDVYRQRYRQGETSLADLFDKERAAHEAALELAETKEQRLQILQELLATARRRHEYVERQIEIAEAPGADALESRAQVLEAEIALARERAG